MQLCSEHVREVLYSHSDRFNRQRRRLELRTPFALGSIQPSAQKIRAPHTKCLTRIGRAGSCRMLSAAVQREADGAKRTVQSMRYLSDPYLKLLLPAPGFSGSIGSSLSACLLPLRRPLKLRRPRWEPCRRYEPYGWQQCRLQKFQRVTSVGP